MQKSEQQSFAFGTVTLLRGKSIHICLLLHQCKPVCPKHGKAGRGTGEMRRVSGAGRSDRMVTCIFLITIKVFTLVILTLGCHWQLSVSVSLSQLRFGQKSSTGQPKRILQPWREWNKLPPPQPGPLKQQKKFLKKHRQGDQTPIDSLSTFCHQVNGQTLNEQICDHCMGEIFMIDIHIHDFPDLTDKVLSHILINCC